MVLFIARSYDFANRLWAIWPIWIAREVVQYMICDMNWPHPLINNWPTRAIQARVDLALVSRIFVRGAVVHVQYYANKIEYCIVVFQLWVLWEHVNLHAISYKISCKSTLGLPHIYLGKRTKEKSQFMLPLIIGNKCNFGIKKMTCKDCMCKLLKYIKKSPLNRNVS